LDELLSSTQKKLQKETNNCTQVMNYWKNQLSKVNSEILQLEKTKTSLQTTYQAKRPEFEARIAKLKEELTQTQQRRNLARYNLTLHKEKLSKLVNSLHSH